MLVHESILPYVYDLSVSKQLIRLFCLFNNSLLRFISEFIYFLQKIYIFLLQEFIKQPQLDKINNFMLETKKSFQQTKATLLQSNYQTAFSWFNQTHNKENPQMLFQSKDSYKKMFKQFLKNNEKMGLVNEAQKSKLQQKQVQRFISKSLNFRKKQNQFEQKFSSDYKIKKKKPIMTLINKLNTITQKIGQTDQHKKQQHKNLFFSQTKKVLQLEQQCMLLEYYYKDKKQSSQNNRNTIKTSINYLRNRNSQESKHTRFEKDNKTKNQLFLTHDQNYFDKIKKINYQKQQKFKNQSFRKAQSNYSFKRQKNFASMEEVIKLNRQNLLFQSNKAINSQQTKQKQNKFNTQIRLFLKFAYIEQTKRSFFDFIDRQGIQKLIDFIASNEFNPKITHKKIQKIIQKITKYKAQYKVQFYDFIELLDTIQQQFGFDLLLSIKQKYPELFVKSEQKLINENWLEIKKQIAPKKYKFMIKTIFQSSKNLILNMYLPVKYIPKLLSNVGISGNDLPRAKLFQFMYWNKKRPEGLSFSQFYYAFLMLGVKNNDWQHIITFFQKIRMKQLLD